MCTRWVSWNRIQNVSAGVLSSLLAFYRSASFPLLHCKHDTQTKKKYILATFLSGLWSSAQKWKSDCKVNACNKGGYLKASLENQFWKSGIGCFWLLQFCVNIVSNSVSVLKKRSVKCCSLLSNKWLKLCKYGYDVWLVCKLLNYYFFLLFIQSWYTNAKLRFNAYCEYLVTMFPLIFFLEQNFSLLAGHFGHLSKNILYTRPVQCTQKKVCNF